MRIDLIITELEVGGAERCCAELALFLQRRAHRVRVLSIGPRPDAGRRELVDRLEGEGVRIEFLGASAWRKLPFAWNKLRQLVHSDLPDVAQSFLWHANVLSAAVYPTYRVPLFGGVRVAEPRRGRHPWSRWASRRMAKVVCVSESIAQWCIVEEKVAPEKLQVIPNGIDIEAFRAKAIHRSNESMTGEIQKPYLLFVGRLALQKGVDILAQRADAILESLPNYQLVIAGDGPLRDELTRRRETSIHKERIHLLGQRSDVSTWMSGCDLLLLPSRYEGMPNVLLEAMALGIPVVTTDVEGIRELIGAEGQRQYVPAEDWDAWATRVVDLARDPNVRLALGQQNAFRIEKHYRLESQLEQYESLYLRAIERSIAREK